MFQYDDHKEKALKDVIPYLLQFPEIYKLTEQSGDRYQVIEDIVWQLLYNLNYQTANGVWLDYLGKKVGQSRIYNPKPTDAFTFGGTNEEGFGQGRFKSADSLLNTKQARTDSSFRNAIKAKIIQNNTDTSLDELAQACKLLFGAATVKIEESYPAQINLISLYGGSLVETVDAFKTITNLLPAGVGLNKLEFHKLINIFENNAFITYNALIPENDDFELSLTLTPDTLPSNGFVIFSQNSTFASDITPISCYYNPNEGIVFTASPDYYNDDNTYTAYYTDEQDSPYVEGDVSIKLAGDADIKINNDTNIKITRVGDEWSLYIDNVLVDQDTNAHRIISSENSRFYLGTSNNQYYNSGAIYNLILKNNTTNELLINDTLAWQTIGTNNGVKFLNG